MIKSIHKLPTIDYFRIVTERKKFKFMFKTYEVDNIDILGNGFIISKLKAWRKICNEALLFVQHEDNSKEEAERIERLRQKALFLYACSKVLSIKSNKDVMKALNMSGIPSDDRYSALTQAKTQYSGTIINLEDAKAETKKNESARPTIKEYLDEFNIINEQMGGTMNVGNPFSVYLSARNIIKARNGRTIDN